MFAALVTVFREVLEASLVVSSVAAALEGISGRALCLSIGVALGIFIAVLVAIFLEELTLAAGGTGHELFNAGVAALAVVMLGWHNIWMSRHSQALVQDIKRLGHSIQAGTTPLTAAAVATAMAVAREGSEIVLFMYGLAAHPFTQASTLLGALLGLLAGVATGLGLYLGLVRLPLKKLFSVVEFFILLLASGLAARACQQLEQAEWLPPLKESMWDTSSIISDGSVVGSFLNGLTGYTARPSGAEVLAYVGTFLIIGGLMLWSRRTPTRKMTGIDRGRNCHSQQPQAKI